MRIALIGAHGQLGSDLRSVLSGEVVPFGRADLDVTDAAIVRERLGGAGFDRIVNCAAYNLVDRAEDDPRAARAVNEEGPRNLGRVAREFGIPVLHVSTDYVFGRDRGRRRPYAEEDAPGPLGVYGGSKLAGEDNLFREQPQSFVVRTCGLYGMAATRAKGNFVETMLRLGRERPSLTIVDDQVCTPTSSLDLARAIAELVGTEAYGLYHATNHGETTWCRLAREIFAIAGIEVDVRPITTAEYGARAERPAYSVLDCSRLADVIGRPLPEWRTALRAYLAARSD